MYKCGKLIEEIGKRSFIKPITEEQVCDYFSIMNDINNSFIMEVQVLPVVTILDFCNLKTLQYPFQVYLNEVFCMKHI